MRVKSRIQAIIRSYPRQFWLVSLVMLMAWLLHSMMWPYLLLFASESLGLPLTSVTWLMTLNAAVGLVTTFLGGAIADRFGRKWVLVFSMVMGGAAWYFFRSAGTLPLFALLLALTGATTPLYRLAADSMIADIIPVEFRQNAYSILRMGNNLGVALGPAIGGWLVSASYSLTFTVIGLGFVLSGIFFALLSVETRPVGNVQDSLQPDEPGGYVRIFKDRIFMMMLGGLTFNRIATSILWLMLAAYAKQNFGLSESIYGFIPATNAVMVVVFQLMVTRQVNKYSPQAAMVVGGLIYAVFIFSVAFGTGFWGFWLCMVGATVGEMILIPTATTFTSRLAPADMRARYMSIYTLAQGIGTGVGPLLGGWSEQWFSSRAMWYTAGLMGLVGTVIFLAIYRMKKRDDHFSEALLADGKIL